MNRRLSSGQFVDYRFVLYQNDTIEAPTDDVDLAFEIQEIQQKIAVTFAIKYTLVDFVSYGPNSTVKLDNFNFDSTTHEGNILLSMIKGSMVFVTGLIGKKTPQNVSLKVPNATIGIRGTEFAVEVEGE